MRATLGFTRCTDKEGEDFQKGQKSAECGKEVRRKQTGSVVRSQV